MEKNFNNFTILWHFKVGIALMKPLYWVNSRALYNIGYINYIVEHLLLFVIFQIIVYNRAIMSWNLST